MGWKPITMPCASFTSPGILFAGLHWYCEGLLNVTRNEARDLGGVGFWFCVVNLATALRRHESLNVFESVTS